MKRIVYILFSSALLLLSAQSCVERFEEPWDSIYYIDEYGDKVCRMFTSYNLTNDSTDKMSSVPFSLPIAVYYNGSWRSEIIGDCNWAFLDRSEGKGVHYIHFTYLQNKTGYSRTAILRITCDNGESVDISLTQESL